MARAEFDQGLADNSKVIQGMTINFKRSAAQEASLQALLKAQQDPGSPSYHKWLTQAEFGQQFGMSSADLDKVTGWLQQEGFTVTAVAASKKNGSYFKDKFHRLSARRGGGSGAICIRGRVSCGHAHLGRAPAGRRRGQRHRRAPVATRRY